MTELTIGSLFSGYGGLDAAVHNVFDAETIWCCDNDPGAARVLADHMPHVPNLGDITAVDWATVTRPNILTGGFPCQDISHAGKQAGMVRSGDSATRSGLWSQMAEAIDTLRPDLVVAENVRALTSAKADSDVEFCPWCMGNTDPECVLRALGAVLGDLADIGFDAQWTGLRAFDIGAPHGRFRIFLLAWPAGDAPMFGWNSVPASGGRHGGPAWPSGRSDPAAVADTSGDGWHEGRPEPAGQLGRPDAAQRGARAAADAYRARLEGVRPVTGGSSFADALGDRPVAADTDSDGLQGIGRQQRPQSDADRRGGQNIAWGAYEPAIRRWEQILGRPAPAPAEPTGRNGGYQLSARFDEWLMGLPEGHVTDPAIWVGVTRSAARNAQLKLCGNGVVPQQAEAAIRLMLDQITTERAA